MLRDASDTSPAHPCPVKVQAPDLHRELWIQRHTLEFKKIGTFFIHVRSFCLENFIETLALQTATGDGEVDESNPGTEIRWELDLPKGATDQAALLHIRGLT